jgi:hypothetical protein
MASQHRTARGIPVDIDRLRLANETSIAVGNMRVNARGDQLGPGGKIVKTRAQILAEKNKLYGALAEDTPVLASLHEEQTLPDLVLPATNTMQNTAEDTPVAETASSYVKPRGSFAESVAKETTVEQELLDPKEVLKTPANEPGIKRI